MVRQVGTSSKTSTSRGWRSCACSQPGPFTTHTAESRRGRMAEFTIPVPEVQALAGRFHWVSIDIDRNVTMATEARWEGSA